MAGFALDGFGGYTRDLFSMLALLWLVCLAISFGGALLIRRSLSGLKPPPLEPPA